jgi:murein DD-endopeptidase MepM/ murein hydrolase activator NlpD
MPKKGHSYTIFILPDPTSKPYSFSIRKKTCHYLLGLLSVSILVLSGFFAQSLSLLGHLAELNLLRNETKGHRVQIQSVIQTVDGLKKDMARLGELDQKLRIMTDLAPRKGGGVNLLAQGGEEEAVAAYLVEESLSPGQEVRHPRENGIPHITASIEKEVGFLRNQAREEEKSFKELIQTISDMKSRWASTPSIWPIEEGWVTSGFGKRISPFTGDLVMHNGLDIAGPRGTKVLSPAVGIVTRVETEHDLGRMIAIDHGYGKVTWYGHLEKQIVKIGQRVERDDVIGFVGSTGRSTGPHLHYEVRVDKIPVNPTKYILN